MLTTTHPPPPPQDNMQCNNSANDFVGICSLREQELKTASRATLGFKIKDTTEPNADHRTANPDLVYEIMDKIQAHLTAPLDPTWFAPTFRPGDKTFIVMAPGPLKEIVDGVFRKPFKFVSTQNEVYYILEYLPDADVVKKKTRKQTVNYGWITIPTGCKFNDAEILAFITDKLSKAGLTLTEAHNHINAATKVRTLSWRFEFEVTEKFRSSSAKRLAPVIFPPDGSESVARLSPEFCEEYRLHPECLKLIPEKVNVSNHHPLDLCTCSTNSKQASGKEIAARRVVTQAAAASYQERRKRKLAELSKQNPLN